MSIWVYIGSSNRLLLDGTKLVLETMLTYHQRCSVFLWFVNLIRNRRSSKIITTPAMEKLINAVPGQTRTTAYVPYLCEWVIFRKISKNQISIEPMERYCTFIAHELVWLRVVFHFMGDIGRFYPFHSGLL